MWQLLETIALGLWWSPWGQLREEGPRPQSEPGTQERSGHRRPESSSRALAPSILLTQGAARCKLRITARAETNTEEKRNSISYHPLPDGSMETSHLTILPLMWTSGGTPLPGATKPCQPHRGSWGQEGSGSSLVLSPRNPINHGLEQKPWRKFTVKSLLPRNLIPHSYHLGLGQEWDGISDGLRADFMVPNAHHLVPLLLTSPGLI